MGINLPTTEKELDLYFMLQRLVVLESEAKRFTMKCGPDFGPQYNDAAIKRFYEAKVNYLKKVKELNDGD